MARPEVVRRIKSYSAVPGYVYQYYFFEVVPAGPGQSEGNVYVYVVSADRKQNFLVRIQVPRSAIAKWETTSGRKLSGTEEYAVAKMALFQIFDESEDLHSTPQGGSKHVTIDESRLAQYLAQLDL